MLISLQIKRQPNGDNQSKKAQCCKRSKQLTIYAEEQLKTHTKQSGNFLNFQQEYLHVLSKKE